MADLTGVTLGKYRLTERLGRGGMAEVYKAYHPRLDRYVAIKVLHSFLAGGEGFLERFEREARAVASLRHPNIVLVHDFDVEDETYYMVMEYVEGITLKDQIQEFSGKGEYMAHEDVISLFQQVSSALDYAHGKGLIHRDIKPSNILLDKNQQVFLTDFGIAHIVSDSQFTVTGTLVGTPAYMSPEQGKGEKVTPISDIYSLGIILYQLLTGKVPYDADTPLAVIHKHVNEPLPMPCTLNPALSPAFESVILKALAKDPADRFEQASDLSRALEDAAAKEQESPVLDNAAPEVRPTMVGIPGKEEPGTVRMETGETDAGEFRTAPMEPDLKPTQVEEPTGQDQIPATEIMGPEEVEPRKEPPAFSAEAETEEPVSAPLVEERKVPTGKVPGKVSPPLVGKKTELAKKKTNLVPFIAGGAVILVIVILLLTGVLGGGASADCGSPEECIQRAHETGGTHDAVEYMDAALSMVNREPAFADWWCQRGEFLEMIGDNGQAIRSFETCMEWAEDDPGLEDIRRWAQESIDRLR